MEKNKFAKEILDIIKEIDNTLSIDEINTLLQKVSIEDIVNLNKLKMSPRQIKTYSEVISKEDFNEFLKRLNNDSDPDILNKIEQIIRGEADNMLKTFDQYELPESNRMPRIGYGYIPRSEHNIFKNIFINYKKAKSVQQLVSDEEIQQLVSDEEIQQLVSDEEIQQLGVLALIHRLGNTLQSGWIPQVFIKEKRMEFAKNYAAQMQQSRGFGGAKGRAVKQEGILALPSPIKTTEQENGYEVVILNNDDKFTKMNIPGKNYYKQGTPKKLGLQPLPNIQDKTNKSWKEPLDRVHAKGIRIGKWKSEGGKTSGLPIFYIPGRRGWSRLQVIHREKLFEVLKRQGRDPKLLWSPIGKIAEGSNTEWFIEISHMVGAGTGGSTRITNAWPASVHQNTEQLAIEEVIRKKDFIGKLSVKFTDYINPETGQAEFMRIKIANKDTRKKIFDHIMDATRGNIDQTEVQLLQETLNEKIKASIKLSSNNNTASGSGDAITLPTESEMKSSNSNNDIMFTDVRTSKGEQKKGTEGLKYLKGKYLLNNQEISDKEKETSEKGFSMTSIKDALPELS